MTRLLHERVARSAERWPDATAVVMRDHRRTYADLERASDGWARVLVEAGINAGDRVALLQPKSPAAIVSMLATLKAGAIYVPIDPASPAERIRRSLSAVEPRLVLASAGAAELLDRLDVRLPTACVDGSLPGALANAG